MLPVSPPNPYLLRGPATPRALVLILVMMTTVGTAIVSQDDPTVVWAYEGKKKMTGCLVCVTAVESGTATPWEEGSALYLAKSSPEYNKTVDQCACAYEKLPAEALPRFGVPETVESTQQLGSMSYVELAFLSEDEITSLTGCTAEQLGQTVFLRLAEDGVTEISGVYVNFADVGDAVPWPEVMAWRKVRFFSTLSTSCIETHLSPERSSTDIWRRCRSQAVVAV